LTGVLRKKKQNRASSRSAFERRCRVAKSTRIEMMLREERASSSIQGAAFMFPVCATHAGFQIWPITRRKLPPGYADIGHPEYRGE